VWWYIGGARAVGVAPRGSADLDIMVAVQTGKLLQLQMFIHRTDNSYTRQGLMCFNLAHRRYAAPESHTHVHVVMSAKHSCLSSCRWALYHSAHGLLCYNKLCVHPSQLSTEV